MITPHYSRFEVKIINKPFYTEGDVNYPATAVISFFDEQGRFLIAEDFGYLTTRQVYSQIDETGSLNLDYCYIKNFSITAFRRLRLIEKGEYIELKSVTAHRAFFDSDYDIDFSFIRILDGNINFNKTHFALGNLNFTHSQFGNGKVDFSYSVIRGAKTDFSNCTFGDGEASFKNAVFYRGEKIFQYTDFGSGDLNFVNTEFGGGETAFINTNFNEGNVSFKVARFGDGRVDFHFSKFGGGDISFERAEFGNGPVDFRTVEFNKGKLNFNRADFGDGEVSFEASGASGKVTFKKTNFGKGDINFELAEFENADVNCEKAIFGKGSLSFLNSHFRSLSLNGCHIDNYLDLRVKKCPYVDLSDTVVRDIIDFKPFDFDVDIQTLNISGMRLLGVIYIDWEKNRVEKLIRDQENTSLDEKAEQFRNLKESFHKAGQYNDEDISYVWFKRYEMKSNYTTSLAKHKMAFLIQSPIHFFQKLILDHAGLYATSPFRVLLAMVVGYLTFTLFYVIALVTHIGGISSGIGGEHNQISLVGRCLYHSGITFFTIGFGDFYPLGIVRWLSNLEGFVGVFLMSYFTVAFVRKILR